MPTIPLIIGLLALSPQTQPPTQPQTPPQTQTAKPQTPTTTPATSTARKPAVLEVRVTDRSGTPLEGAEVVAEGALGRKGDTDRNGVVTLRNVPAGTYRFRFEREGYVALEKEVVVRAGVPAQVDAALTAAPPPPPPPAPPPAPKPTAPPPAPTAALPPPGDPKVLSIGDFAESQPLGRSSPLRESPIGCSGVTNAKLIQARDLLDPHSHATADEVLYVAGGEGTLKLGGKDYPISAGSLILVPRGMDHSITRKGRTPVALISILGGQACADSTGQR